MSIAPEVPAEGAGYCCLSNKCKGTLHKAVSGIQTRKDL